MTHSSIFHPIVARGSRCHFVLFALCIPLAGVTACGQESDDLDSELEFARSSSQWMSEECEPLPDNQGGTIYKTREYRFAGHQWALDLDTYGDDETCTQPQGRFTASGTLEVRGRSTLIAGAYRVFFGFEERTMTPLSEQSAGFMNSLALCDRTDWAADVPVDVHEEGCAALNVPAIELCPGEYDAVKLEGGKLYLGQRTDDTVDNACLPDNYPGQLIDYALVLK